jgi:hypothetical protein
MAAYEYIDAYYVCVELVGIREIARGVVVDDGSVSGIG